MRRTLGEWQVKPRRKFVNLKIESYIQKHNKTVIPEMKTKRKKKKKKERKEAKRKRFCAESISRPSTHWTKALPLGQVEHTGKFIEILLLKPSSLIKHEFKDIFQKNDCSFDSETST